MPPLRFPVGFHDSRLSIPTPAEGAIARHRLTQRLDGAIRAHPVTLVVGGAGTGKTHAMATWCGAVATAADPPVVAWVSVDRADADHRVFWVSVVSALQRVVDSEQMARLSVPSRSSQHFFDTVVHALSEVDDQVVLVLDDVHEIFGTRSIELLEQLQHGLPSRHRLVLVSRYDPPLRLHRLRLSGGLGEIRAAELAFTTAEAGELMRQSGTDLPDGALETLMTTTEGWAAGLRLAALAITPGVDAGAALAQFDGRNALVSAYLVEEVIAGLGADRADFLMRTSVVDRVCAPLARALTDDPSAGAVLESLAADHALVFALEDSGWYRYHRMLLQMLRGRLRAVSPDLAADLHRRAAEWFEGSGESLEAIRHAMLAEDEAAAAQLVLRAGAVLVFTPDRASLAETLAPLAGRGGVRTDEPERELCLALRSYGLDDDAATDAWVRRAGEGLAGLPEPRRAIATCVHALLASAQARRHGDPQVMLHAAQEALAVASALPLEAGSAVPVMQSVATSLGGVAELWRGRPDAAQALLRSSVIDLDERTFGMHARLYHAGLIALAEVSRGHLRNGERSAREGLEAARAVGWTESYESGPTWLALSIAALLRVDLPEVERCLAMARRTRIEHRDPFVGAMMGVVEARAALTARDLPRARRALGRVDRWREAYPTLPLLTVLSGTLVVEGRLAAGEPRLAAAALATLDAELARQDGRPPSPSGTLEVTRAHVLLATGLPLEAIEAVSSLFKEGGVAASEAWLVTALAQDRRREDASSAESMARALQLAEAEDAPIGFLRPSDRLPHLLRRHLDVLGHHRDFAARVLAMLDTAGPSGIDVGPAVTQEVSLTERELSVLACLPALSTNSEIAEQLSISVNTVKQHLKTINRKLEVTSKREAVRVARRLGYLPYPG